jgi:hypothetical protein
MCEIAVLHRAPVAQMMSDEYGALSQDIWVVQHCIAYARPGSLVVLYCKQLAYCVTCKLTALFPAASLPVFSIACRRDVWLCFAPDLVNCKIMSDRGQDIRSFVLAVSRLPTSFLACKYESFTRVEFD